LFFTFYRKAFLKITSKNLIRNHIQKIPIKQLTNGLLVELIWYQ